MTMDAKRLNELAKKIKDNTATEEDKIAFFKGVNELLEELRAFRNKS